MDDQTTEKAIERQVLADLSKRDPELAERLLRKQRQRQEPMRKTPASQAVRKRVIRIDGREIVVEYNEVAKTFDWRARSIGANAFLKSNRSFATEADALSHARAATLRHRSSQRLIG